MLPWFAWLLLLAVFIAALVLGRRRADHLPFTIFTAWLLASDALRAAIADHYGLIRPPGLPPFTGPARIAFHIDEAIGLADPTVMAILAIVVFAQRHWLAWAPALAWALATAYLATHYPEVRGEPLRSVYLAAELTALTLSAAAIITWGWRREPMTPARTCTLLVCLVDGGLLLAGAQRWGFWSRWDLQQYAISLLYIALVTQQVIAWRSLSRS